MQWLKEDAGKQAVVSASSPHGLSLVMFASLSAVVMDAMSIMHGRVLWLIFLVVVGYFVTFARCFVCVFGLCIVWVFNLS